MAKSLVWRILLKLIALIMFFVIILVANILAIFINDPFFLEIMGSINSNLGLIFMIALLFFFKEVFEMLPFPLNLPYPLLNAVASVILIAFLFDLITLTGVIPGWNDFLPLRKTIIYPLVVVLALVLGYWSIFRKEQKKKKKLPKFKKHRKVKRTIKKSREKVKKKK